MLYPYNEMLFSHNEKWSSDVCHNMDKPWKHNAKWKPATKDHIFCDFIEIKKARRDKSSEKESRWVAPGAGGRRAMESHC